MLNKKIFDLSGKIAVVTGSGRGIGKSLALALANAGANVAVIDVNEVTANQTKDEIINLGRQSLSIGADLRKKDEIDSAIKKIVDVFGRIDVGVNNIGNLGPSASRLSSAEDIDVDNFRKQIDTYLIGYFLLCQAEARQMIKQMGGHIINISAGAATRPPRGLTGMAPYCAVKAGVNSMTRALALDWAKYNITVNTISPGYIITPANEDIIPQRKDLYTSQTPLGRIGLPNDLDGAIVFLASEGGNWVTGQDLRVDGGLTI